MSELRVVFLGTSSGKPTLTRNVSAVALLLDGQLVLFDCGEGTQLQVVRAGVRPSRLLLVAISHFHGDHVNGLPGFLSTMGINQHDRPVAVAGPRGLREYFRTLRKVGIFAPRFQVEVNEIADQGEIYATDSFRILTARLDHRIETWGFRFEERDRPGRFNVEAALALGVPQGPLFGRLQRGESITLADGRTIQPDQVLGPTRRGRVIAYVPDTRPCPGAVWLAQDADLLVHEGTYSHEFAADADERGHSTVVQAAEVARQARAKRLILTHISPKHDDPRPLLAEARRVFPDAQIAKDLLSVEVELLE